METKTVEIVFIHPDLAYATYPYLPYAELSNFKGDLKAVKRDVAYNSDTAPQQGADMPRFEVRTVELPSWIGVDYYIRNSYHADILFNHFGRAIEKTFFMKWVGIYKKAGIDGMMDLIKIYEQKNFRSEFRQSIKNQVMAWFDNPSPQYEVPLSPRQMQCIRPYRRY